MSTYRTEEEQIQLLKDFMKQYGQMILMGVLVVLSLLLGWRYWRAHQMQVIFQASTVYEQLIDSALKDDLQKVQQQADYLIQNYHNTPYASMGAMILAGEHVEKRDYASASKQLNWVVENTHSAALKQLAKINLARLLLQQQKLEQALSMLEPVAYPAYQPYIDKVKGDIYLAQGKKPEARRAYQNALSMLPEHEMIRPLLKMRVEDLAPAQPSAQSSK